MDAKAITGHPKRNTARLGTLTKVGENVRARVDAVGLNRQQFPTALGITWGNADGICRGRQCPSLLTLARIAGVVGCKPAELLAGVEPRPGEIGQLLMGVRL